MQGTYERKTFLEIHNVFKIYIYDGNGLTNITFKTLVEQILWKLWLQDVCFQSAYG